ncbi:angiopoietin-related protein 7-like [Drosophila takahashii]|uniref:angiopoietin-related protein 7-like n=1 Tax=Drosophila takahashii TaxID=29030 RepID=UPI003898FBE3
MKPGILLIFLTISVLDRLSPGDGANLPQENLETKCKGYCFTILKPFLDNAVLPKSADDANNELSGQVTGGNSKDLQNQLAIAELQIKSKETISTLQGQLANAECQVKLKDLIIVKDKEIHEKTEQIKCKEDLIKLKDKEIDVQNEQIKYYNEKVNNMTEIIRNLQTQLANAEAQIKINDKEINDKCEHLKNNEDQIKEQINQIKNKAEEVITKSNAVKDLSAQISTKDNQINGLNNRIKSVSEELLKYNGTDECPKSGPSGIYVLKVPGNVLMEVPCNSTGWIVVLRRQDGSVDFERSWKEYKEGFGNLTGEFFIGLEKLHQLTKRQPHEVYIKIVDVHGEVRHAQYDNFKVSYEENHYHLDSVGTYSGTAGDSLSYSSGRYFTTIDRDNDGNGSNCAKSYSGGGWWYNSCSYSYLTGKFYKDGTSPSQTGINWYHYRNDYTTSFTYVEMMIKPKLL